MQHLQSAYVLDHPRGWGSISQKVRDGLAHRNLRVETWQVPHPNSVSGFYSSIGQNVLAKEHWRYKYRDGTQLHVLVFDDHYQVHWDYYDARSQPVQHMLRDAPVAASILGTVAAAIIKRVLRRTK